ncbi:MAG: metal transporter [Gammaproteobacteria bacterium]|nr:metal transporter [Gammaproteobacteria bacterium]
MDKQTSKSFSTWGYVVIPLILLVGLIFLFLNTNPIQVATGDLPPIETLNIQRIELPKPGMIEMEVVNAGPDEITISQILVDDAYWHFTMGPSNTLSSLEEGKLSIPYPWVETEAHEIVIITSTGATFNAEIELAVQTPSLGTDQFFAYALVGVYVGIIPVGLGMLWYPAMRRFSSQMMNFILSLTVGLLIFLLVDTYLEMVEVAEQLPGVFQGLPFGLFVALLTWLSILAIGNMKRYADRETPQGRRFVAFLIALGIGFHNLGEGLVVGAAFALGEAALGSFLVVGFILHNLTEGIGIAAPVVKDRPKLVWFLGMLLVAGAPAIPGAIIGGFAYSPLLTVLFLGIGVGAIWQVIVEVGRILEGNARRNDEMLVNWVNVAGLLVGILVMYLTGFIVKV